MDKDTEVQEVLIDMQRVTTHANHVKDRIIIALIILLFTQAFATVSTNAYYKKQISNMTVTQTNANAERCTA